MGTAYSEQHLLAADKQPIYTIPELQQRREKSLYMDPLNQPVGDHA